MSAIFRFTIIIHYINNAKRSGGLTRDFNEALKQFSTINTHLF